MIITLEDVNEALRSAKWKFAKSMPRIPHEYTLKRDWDPADFLVVVKKIKQFSKPEKFYSKTYDYYRMDLHKYWVMDADPNDVELINRAIW